MIQNLATQDQVNKNTSDIANLNDTISEISEDVETLNENSTLQQFLQNNVSIGFCSGGSSSVSSGFEVSVNNGDKLFQFETDTSNHLWVRVKWKWGSWSSWKQLI